MFDRQAEPLAFHRTHPQQPGRTTIVVDIDDTLCDTDYFRLILQTSREKSRPISGSKDTLVRLAERFEIIYLTSRPSYLQDNTRAWLGEHGYPPAPVYTASQLRELISQRRYKTRSLGELLQRHPNAYIGIGDRDSDAAAYRAHRMLTIIVNPDEDSSFHSSDIVLRNWADVDAFFQANAALLEDPAQVRAAAQKGVSPFQVPSQVKLVRFDDVDDDHGRGRLNRALIRIFPKFESNARKQKVAAQVLAGDLELRTAIEAVARKWPEARVISLGLSMADDRPAVEVTLLRDGTAERVLLDAANGDELQSRPYRPKSKRLQKVWSAPHEYISPLAAIDIATRRVDARPYRIELLSEYNRPTYEVSLLSRKGFWEVDVDAATGLLQEVDHRWRLIPLN